MTEAPASPHRREERSNRRLILLLVIGAIVALGGLGAVTRQALALEAGERRAQQVAKFQEALRLALWRMDSAMTPIIAREAARPYFEYQSFYPADRSFSTMLQPAQSAPGEGAATLVASPLLNLPDPRISLHFQRDQSGTVTSPQAPRADWLALAEGVYVTPYTVQLGQARLEELSRKLAASAPPQGLLAMGSSDLPDRRPKGEGEASSREEARELRALGADAEVGGAASTGVEPSNASSAPGTQAGLAQPPDDTRSERDRGDKASAEERAQLQRAGEEYLARKKVAQEAQFNVAPSVGSGVPGAKRSSPNEAKEGGQAADESAPGDAPPPSPQSPPLQPSPSMLHVDSDQAVTQSEFIARWIDGDRGEPELLFVREVRVGSSRYEQGFWVDWHELRAMLLEQTRGILPGATLVPVIAPGVQAGEEALGSMLATVPAQLVVAQPMGANAPGWTPLKTTLVATWTLVLASLVGLGVVVRASTELAERRGRFVSAVTHELRTPLTTFRMYSQMLAEGMVAEDARRAYARTLFEESGRLTRIVESVLDYARMGRGGGRSRQERVTVAALRDRLAPVLEGIAHGAGVRIEWTGPDDALASRELTTDPAQVERIVANLVDNACKYGASEGLAPASSPQSPTPGSAGEASDPRPVVQVSLRASEGRALAIRVRDFGPGIPPRDARRIFRAFVRGERHAHASVPGMGLGLALSRGIAEQLGGELVLVQASPGAAFELRL